MQGGRLVSSRGFLNTRRWLLPPWGLNQGAWASKSSLGELSQDASLTPWQGPQVMRQTQGWLLEAWRKWQPVSMAAVEMAKSPWKMAVKT